MLEEDRNLVRIASFEHEHEAILCRQLLNRHGIPAWVTGGDGVNTFGAGLTAAGLVAVDVRIHKINEPLARSILEQHALENAQQMPAWICKCGANVDEGFSVCWSCGTDIDDLLTL